MHAATSWGRFFLVTLLIAGAGLAAMLASRRP
jgi:hypothetical protein